MRIKNQRRRGATAVETAFVFIICFLFICAIFEYCRYLMVSQLVNNAVREGARQAVVSTNTQSTATIQQTVITYLANQPILNSSGKPLTTSDVQVYQSNPVNGSAASPDSLWYDAALGSTIVVKVNVLFQPLMPNFGFLPKVFTIQATAQMRSEAN